MNTEFFLIQLGFTALLACIIGSNIHRYNRHEAQDLLDGKQRYLPYFITSTLPIYFLISFLFRLGTEGWQYSGKYMFSMYFGVFLHICIYYLILLLLLSYFRNKINARTCAVLWILPNYLYITVDAFSNGLFPKPLVVLHLRNGIIQPLAFLWFIGFSSILLWKLFSHYRFRRMLLKNSLPVTDSTTLDVWAKELQFAGAEKTLYKLVYSPLVKSPLSIGFIEETTHVILPDHQYNRDDLALIFRHELIHIGRQDCLTKFFLLFYSAICWFNPLMWIAMRRSAEDLELSCDETVLLRSDQQTRTRYAELLLQTAGDERGFTTCLAASMDAMRYRLKSIVTPSKRATGSFLVAIVFFILTITCGYISLSYHETTGHDAIFHSEDMEQFSLVYPGMNGRLSRGEQVKLTCTDEVALFEYLSELQVCQITGSYALYEVDEEFTLDYLRPDGRPIYVDISKNYLRVTHPGQSWAQRDVYYIPDGADWEYLTSLFTSP